MCHYNKKNVLKEFLREASRIPLCLQSEKLLASPRRSFSSCKECFWFISGAFILTKTLCKSSDKHYVDYESVTETVNITEATSCVVVWGEKNISLTL